MAEKKITVRMVGRMSGTRDGQDWPPVGGVADVSDVEAESLIAAGFAVEVSGTDGPVEASTPTPITTAAMDGRVGGRGRKKG